MKVLVGMCFIKSTSEGIDTKLVCEIIDATSQTEALGIMLRDKPQDRQVGAYMAKEIK